MAKKRSHGYKKRQMMKMRKTCKIVSVLVYFSTAVSFCSELKRRFLTSVQKLFKVHLTRKVRAENLKT